MAQIKPVELYRNLLSEFAVVGISALVNFRERRPADYKRITVICQGAASAWKGSPRMMMSEEDGWYFAADSDNVGGRFEDFKLIDGPASKAARKNVYRVGVSLRTKIHMTVVGTMSHEMGCECVLYMVVAPEAPLI